MLNAVVRALYAYFMDWPPEVCPHLDVPLHTLIELREAAYGCEERRHALEPFYGSRAPVGGMVFIRVRPVHGPHLAPGHHPESVPQQ